MPIKQFVITKDNISMFKSPEWQRIPKEKTISKFNKAIRENKFHGTVLTVNSINDIFRIVNGNHRLNSIRSAVNEGASVSVILDIHENLSVQEEKNLFQEMAIETPQTIDDMLYIFKDEIPVLKMIEKKFPVMVRIYQHDSALRFKHLVNARWNMDNPNTFGSGIGSKEKILKIAKSMDENDYKLLYNFFSLYSKAVGLKQDNPFYRPIVLLPILSIFMRHKSNIMLRTVERYTNEKWNALFKKMLVDHILISYSEMMTSREKIKEVRNRILFLSLPIKSGLI